MPKRRTSTPQFTRIAPRSPKREDCGFYHSYSLPDEEIVGQWDLRGDTASYLGHTDFKDQSVLEVGPASGFLSFHMEQAGASVTCIEPTMSHLWDIVPIEGFDGDAWRREFEPNIEKVRNSFWYVHQKLNSKVRMVELDPYRIPAELGDFDIGLLTSVLLHCRRPFDLLESVAARAKRKVIVTESYVPSLGEGALCGLMPHRGAIQVHTWWMFTPQFFVSALGLMGFTQARIVLHKQKQPAEENRDVDLFTVVCERPTPST